VPKVIFKATAKRKEWLHKKGGKVVSSYAGRPTTKVASPVILRDGDECDMDKFEAAWCLQMMPDNFSTKAKKARSYSYTKPKQEDE
jgi:hypothetical protein